MPSTRLKTPTLLVCLLFAVIIGGICGIWETQAGPALDHAERDDISQAENAIVTSLAITASSHGESLCTQAPLACFGPDRTELAMSLLGARNSPDSLRALASLLRFAFDGGNYENYHEIVAEKGKTIRPYISAISPKSLHARCMNELAELIRITGSALGQVREGRVCQDEETITAQQELFLKGR